MIDTHGQLRIIDRAGDVGKDVKGGAMLRPTTSRTSSSSSRVKEAVCFGHDKDKVCAFINIDFDAVGNWAERQNRPTPAMWTWPPRPGAGADRRLRGPGERRPGGRTGMAETGGALSGAAKELDPDDDELTRTRKVRHNFIADKYGVLIDALYDGRASSSSKPR